MTPAQFLTQLKRQEPGPAYLFLGAEPYRRQACGKALLEKVLPGEAREQGLAHFDLRETSWSAVVDDACSLSLFAPRRVVWVSNAEASLPRGKVGEEGAGTTGPLGPLPRYLKQPTPGVVLVVEASRFELDGEDKAKADRVRKLYSAIPAQVEFPRFSAAEARAPDAGIDQSVGPRYWRGTRWTCWWIRWARTPCGFRWKSRSCGCMRASAGRSA